MAKRGRPKTIKVYKSTPEELEKYLKGILSFDQIAREKTCADCREFITLPKSLCNLELFYKNIYPRNLGKEFQKYEFFRIVNLITGEIFERGTYMSVDDFRWYVNNKKYRLDVGR
jgi:hypothetical protein